LIWDLLEIRCTIPGTFVIQMFAPNEVVQYFNNWYYEDEIEDEEWID